MDNDNINPDNLIPLDDVKPVQRRKLNALDVKKLSTDGAFWVAIFLMVSRLIPSFGDWVQENQDAFYPLYIVLAGHLGIRAVSAKAKGDILSGEK